VIPLPRADYSTHFAGHEHPYPGKADWTEVVVPPEKLDLLSQYPRTWSRDG